MTALRSQLEAAQRLAPETEEIGAGSVGDTQRDRPVLVLRVPRLVERGLLGDVRDPESAVLDVFRDLVRIWRATPMFVALAAPAGKRADSRHPFVVLHVVGVVLVLWRSVRIHEPGQAKPCAEIAEDRLEAAHVAVRFDHGPADGICGRLGFTDGTVKERNAVMPLKIRGVGQDQVRVGHHLRRVGIRIDYPGDRVFAAVILVRQHLHDAGRVHRRIPCHVRHVEKHGVDPVGISGMRIRDEHVHETVRAHRVLPRERLVDALRIAVFVDQQIVRSMDKAKQWSVERLTWRHACMGLRVSRRGLRVRWLESEPAGNLDAAQNDLQEMQRPASLEAVGVCADPAHGVETDRTADHP